MNLKKLLFRFIPILESVRGYNVQSFKADFISGLTVALVLIPQSMAYAQLADLPAYYGLYAAFLPPMIAVIFGSSKQLATGPVAIVSLMTSTALAPLASAGSEQFLAYVLLLSILVGTFQFLLGILKLGMVVNFLSHPVVNGFTNAGAIIIATSQLSKIFGVDVAKAEHHYQTIYNVVIAAIHHTHFPTLALGALAFLIMIILKKVNPKIPNVLVAVVVTTLISYFTGFEKNRVVDINDIKIPEVQHLTESYNSTLSTVDSLMTQKLELGKRLKEAQRMYGAHSVESIAIDASIAEITVTIQNLREHASHVKKELRDFRLIGSQVSDDQIEFYLPESEDTCENICGRHWAIVVKNGSMDEHAITLRGGGSVVGTIPSGLPSISAPKIDFGIMVELFPMAIIISLLGFMEAISIAKAMAARTGQRLDPNQELIGQGLANLLGSFSLSYPVSGSFSRSAVNLQAGAITGLSSVFSSLFVLLTLQFFTKLLYHLPQAVLASVIMMAVIGLVNVSGFVHAWKAQKYDGIISVLTFLTTLYFAPELERGIFVGIILSLVLFFLRNMKPRMAVLSKSPDGHYRNAERWKLETCRHVSVIRFNNSLFFANVNYLEDEILAEVASNHSLKHILIVGNGINELDASGEVLLSQLVTRLRESGIDISFTGLNDHVTDVLKRTHLYDKIGNDHFYHNIEMAVNTIHKGTCLVSKSERCPLLLPKFDTFEVEVGSSQTMMDEKKLFGKGPIPTTQKETADQSDS